MKIPTQHKSFIIMSSGNPQKYTAHRVGSRCWVTAVTEKKSTKREAKAWMNNPSSSF